MAFELEDLRIIITTKSLIKCPHGGSVQLKSTAKYPLSNGYKAVKWTDPGIVSGCCFRVGGKPQPCAKMNWVTYNPLYTVDGVPGVAWGNVGICKNSNNVAQGPAIVLQV